MEKAIEIFVAISLSVIALSHILQPSAWVDFFVRLREKGRAGVFAFGLLCLNFGAVVVAFHNVWHGWPVIFTIVGWGQVLNRCTCWRPSSGGGRWGAWRRSGRGSLSLAA
jgi:hypothetical protein